MNDYPEEAFHPSVRSYFPPKTELVPLPTHMKLDPNAPAFLNILDAQQDGGHTNFEGPRGLTIRAEIASRIMAGMVANPRFDSDIETISSDAVRCADALIEELNKD